MERGTLKRGFQGITEVSSVVGKVFCKILNKERLDKGLLHEGQAGFRLKISCIDNVYTLNELVQGRLREGKTTYAFFLDVQKAYNTVWRDGLWLKLWDMGVKVGYDGLLRKCMSLLGVQFC